MMEGIHATSTVYGFFAEKYLYFEEEIEEVRFLGLSLLTILVPFKVPGLVIEANEPAFNYDITSKFKVSL